MTEIKIDVQGVRDVQQALAKYGEEAVRALDAAVQQTAIELVGAAKGHAPVDTGRLRAGIHFEKKGLMEALVTDDVEYGAFQEFGTSRMNAHPFMQPAMDDVRPDWERRVLDALNEAGRNAGRR